MTNGTIGVAAMGGGAKQVVSTIQDFELRGIKAAWLTAGAGGWPWVRAGRALGAPKILRIAHLESQIYCVEIFLFGNIVG